jgi:putative transposase
MVEDPKDYRWSSYRAYAYGKRDVLLDKHPVYLQLSEEEGERWRKYREFVRGMLKEKEAMKGEMDRRIVYGGEDFLKGMLVTYHISAKIKQIGRQRGWRKNKENRPL